MMPTTIRFMGAAQNVTGSRYLLEVNGFRLLIDCGLYQERELRGRNWNPFAVPAESIHAVLLTHAHLDHCGLLPKLVREGFKGEVYCTSPTAEIAQITLLDSAKIQEEDAAFKLRRHKREGRRGRYPEVPLYTTEDAEDTFPLFRPVSYEQPTPIADGIRAIFHDAGHILGSSSITVMFGEGTDSRTVLFSGDVGRWDRPILRNPSVVDAADYVVVESTYGDRLHENTNGAVDALSDVINATVDAGGNLIIPAFSIGRTQELLYALNQLQVEKRIPHLLVLVDSPMAVRATEVFIRHPECFDSEMSELISNGVSPFDFDGLKLIRSIEESKAINRIKGTVIVIAGSGMCTGGRIKHHLAKNISRPDRTVLFVGYQAKGTLGREIVEGAKEIRVLGQKRKVKAKISQISGFSAHADRDELLRWLSGFKRAPERVFVTHGEHESALSFAEFLKTKTGWTVDVPAYMDSVELS